MNKKIFLIVLVAFFLSFFPLPVRAEYMLPYPSYMPGNKLYAVSKVFEIVSSLWSWGSIGQVKYHMWLADKYLVEAKTLFEYKQYVFAIRALHTSDEHIAKVPAYIGRGEHEGKDMRPFSTAFASELEVHKQVLSKLESELPKTYLWAPEKQESTMLDLSGELAHSISLRLAP